MFSPIGNDEQIAVEADLAEHQNKIETRQLASKKNF